MEFETSDKESSSFKAPHIRKNYYAGKFVDIKEWTDKEGNLIEAKYGKKVILTFAVYHIDEHGNVGKQVMASDANGNESPVELPLFIYHIYKDQKTGEFRTAFTRNSKITRLFEALGWKFDGTKSIDPTKFLGNWIEVNVDDYEKTDSLTEEKYTASIIKDFNKFKGKTPKTSEPKEETKPTSKEDETEVEEVKDNLTEDQKEKIKNIEKLFKDGEISKEGYERAIAQIKAGA